jgi:para-nitrobenzyl esterase
MSGTTEWPTMSARRRPRAFFAVLAALILAAACIAVGTGVAGAAGSDPPPIVKTDNGVVHGLVLPDGYAFRGLPYAAPPTGHLRWRAPRPPADWTGVRDATEFAPNCPQPPRPPTIGVTNEDCLYLNVSTPRLGTGEGRGRPVLVWIHGGGLRSGAGRDYDPTKLAANGIVVVTVNYRLGALGFLAHPALASSPGGPTGNYGLMDQQAALRWVGSNIARFGGDPDNVTIAGESAGGLSVLAQLVSRGARGLFQRAIVQSGSFALTQQSLASAEAAGEAFASSAGCPDQTAACLRHLPVADIVDNFTTDAIPGVVDGKVLTESVGTALAAGRFARVPILNGTNHDEERIFVALGFTVSGGTDVPIRERPVTAENYQRNIAFVLGASEARAAAIAAEYPLDAYATPTVAFSMLVADANFACPALQIDDWTAARVPTFAYEFNDDAAPLPLPLPLDPPVATHTAELAYLFDLPGATFSGPFSPDQLELAAGMRAAWASFARRGDPSTAAVPWPSVGNGAHVMSLVPPKPQVETDFAPRHHCPFWATG